MMDQRSLCTSDLGYDTFVPFAISTVIVSFHRPEARAAAESQITAPSSAEKKVRWIGVQIRMRRLAGIGANVELVRVPGVSSRTLNKGRRRCAEISGFEERARLLLLELR
jgi:hypothetical protein